MKLTKSKYDLIFRILNQASHVKNTNVKNNNNLWVTWLKSVAAALYLECLFKEDVEKANKPIFKHIGVLGNGSYGKNSIFNWCANTYDPYHPLRFNVETIDNIESIRTYLKDKSEEKGFHVHLHNLLELDTPWEKGKFKEI